MDTRTRYLAALGRQPVDRLPLCELSFWPETLQRWEQEGLAPGTDLNAHFGLDPLVCVNDLFEPSLGLPIEVLEETADFRVARDGYGKVEKHWRQGSSPPALVEPAIRKPADWERLRPHLRVGPDKLNNPVAEAQYHAAKAAGHFTAITPCEPLWFVLHHTMGYELGLTAMLRQRDMVAEMVQAYTDYLLGMLTLLHERGYRFDALWFWSDLCYRNGLLFSPRVGRELVLPQWQRLGAFVRDHGMRFIFHCDGDVHQLIPLLLEAGCDALHPLEVRAGNDAREYKRQYGDRLCLIGNINADVVATNDCEAIEREVAGKIPVLAAGGGYIYHIDHSVPPTISLPAYRHLLACVRRYDPGLAAGAG